MVSTLGTLPLLNVVPMNVGDFPISEETVRCDLPEASHMVSIACFTFMIPPPGHDCIRLTY